MRAGPANLRFPDSARDSRRSRSLTRLRRFGMTSLILELPEYQSFVELIGRGAKRLATGPLFPSSAAVAVTRCGESPSLVK